MAKNSKTSCKKDTTLPSLDFKTSESSSEGSACSDGISTILIGLLYNLTLTEVTGANTCSILFK